VLLESEIRAALRHFGLVAAAGVSDPNATMIFPNGAGVCAMKVGEFEMPSDILGIVWTTFDASGAWKQGLAKELDAAGHAVNWDKGAWLRATDA
jgi:hypothetical protein